MDQIIKGNQNTTKLINELKKSISQYPVLSKDEEKALIEKYKDDRDALNKLLFLHNIKIVFNMAKKYMAQAEDFDNLVQDGMTGLGEAIKRFDTTKDIKLITYAVPWIKKYILMHFYNKNSDIQKNSISLNSTEMSNKIKDQEGSKFENYVNEYVDKSCTNIKSLQSELSSHEQIELCTKLYEILENDSSLSSVEKNVFTDAFYNKEKTRLIASKYNIDIRQVVEIKNKILQKFKDILQKKYSIYSYSDIYDL